MQKVDGRGKFFTERMSKHNVDVVIVTIQGHLRGQMHIMPGQRVKDLLNNGAEQFVAVTHAVVTVGGRTEEIGFIAINKQHIVSVVPINEPNFAQTEEEYPPY